MRSVSGFTASADLTDISTNTNPNISSAQHRRPVMSVAERSI